MKKTALIVAGGQVDAGQLAEQARQVRSEGGLLIAADRGLEALRRLNLRPDAAVGDFDSVSEETLAFYTADPAIRFERHRPEKNESDTELAFCIAREEDVKEVRILGATGTRLDHVLANVHLLKEAFDLGMDCCLLDSHNRLRLAAGRTVFRRAECPYPYISFVPLTMEVTHMRLSGFKYPLYDHHMVLGVECGHCISNELAEEVAVLEFAEGLLLAIESKD